MLDLQNRRATRANDLWLENEGDQLQLRLLTPVLALSAPGLHAVATRAWLRAHSTTGSTLSSARRILMRLEREGYHLRVRGCPQRESAHLSDCSPICTR